MTPKESWLYQYRVKQSAKLVDEIEIINKQIAALQKCRHEIKAHPEYVGISIPVHLTHMKLVSTEAMKLSIIDMHIGHYQDMRGQRENELYDMVRSLSSPTMSGFTVEEEKEYAEYKLTV